MTVHERLRNRNQEFFDGFSQGKLTLRPRLSLLILTCLDPRVDPARIFGLQIGDAVVMRNAGGRVTGDVMSSLAIVGYLASSASVGSTTMPEMVIMHHTDCGMAKLASTEAQQALAQPLGRSHADIAEMAVTDPHESVRDDMAKLLATRGLADSIAVSGCVYDVRTGRVSEVQSAVVPD